MTNYEAQESPRINQLFFFWKSTTVAQIEIMCLIVLGLVQHQGSMKTWLKMFIFWQKAPSGETGLHHISKNLSWWPLLLVFISYWSNINMAKNEKKNALLFEFLKKKKKKSSSFYSSISVQSQDEPFIHVSQVSLQNCDSNQTHVTWFDSPTSVVHRRKTLTEV